MYDLIQPRARRDETDKRFLAESMAGYALVAFVAGSLWIGKTVGQWAAWLIDQEAYWNFTANDARETLLEAESKLAEIRDQMDVASREDPAAIITDDPNAAANDNGASSWL